MQSCYRKLCIVVTEICVLLVTVYTLLMDFTHELQVLSHRTHVVVLFRQTTKSDQPYEKVHFKRSSSSYAVVLF